MAVGERIRFIRNIRGMTQKYLGNLVGFEGKTAEVRMAQYETGVRTPKTDLLEKTAASLGVRPEALDIPNINSYINLAHTLFALEDIYGVKIDSIDGELCLTLDKTKGLTYLSMYEMFKAWHKKSVEFENGEIDEEAYNDWRYNYPKGEAEKSESELRALKKNRG